MKTINGTPDHRRLTRKVRDEEGNESVLVFPVVHTGFRTRLTRNQVDAIKAKFNIG